MLHFLISPRTVVGIGRQAVLLVSATGLEYEFGEQGKVV